VHHEALACELAGRFYLQLGSPAVSTFLLCRARRSYRKWGALGLVRRLDEEFANLADERGSVTHPGSEPSHDGGSCRSPPAAMIIAAAGGDAQVEPRPAREEVGVGLLVDGGPAAMAADVLGERAPGKAAVGASRSLVRQGVALFVLLHRAPVHRRARLQP